MILHANDKVAFVTSVFGLAFSLSVLFFQVWTSRYMEGFNDGFEAGQAKVRREVAAKEQDAQRQVLQRQFWGPAR